MSEDNQQDEGPTLLKYGEGLSEQGVLFAKVAAMPDEAITPEVLAKIDALLDSDAKQAASMRRLAEMLERRHRSWQKVRNDIAFKLKRKTH